MSEPLPTAEQCVAAARAKARADELAVRLSVALSENRRLRARILDLEQLVGRLEVERESADIDLRQRDRAIEELEVRS